MGNHPIENPIGVDCAKYPQSVPQTRESKSHRSEREGNEGVESFEPAFDYITLRQIGLARGGFSVWRDKLSKLLGNFWGLRQKLLSLCCMR